MSAITTADDLPSPARVQPLDAFQITQVSVGRGYGLALTEDGNIVAWGTNQQGEVGRPPGSPNTVWEVSLIDGLENVSGVEAGNSTSGAIVAGQVFTWGSNLQGSMGSGSEPASRTGTPTNIGLDDVTYLELGPAFTGWAVHSDGSMHAWGDNGYWQLGTGGGDTNVPVPVTLQ